MQDLEWMSASRGCCREGCEGSVSGAGRRGWHRVLWVLILGLLLPAARGAETGEVMEVRSAAVEGNWDGETARLVLQAQLAGGGADREPVLYGLTVEHALRASATALVHRVHLSVAVIRGVPRELAFPLRGEGRIREVKAPDLLSWSERRDASGTRALVLRLGVTNTPSAPLSVEVSAETPLGVLPAVAEALAIAAEQPSLGNGFVRLDSDAGLSLELERSEGLVPVDVEYLPETLRGDARGDASGSVRAYRFHGTAYALPVRVSVADPEARQVVLTDFQLVGDLKEGGASFRLEALARVRNPRGGTVTLLEGAAALSQPVTTEGWMLRFSGGRFEAVFPESGEYRIQLPFHAAVASSNGWKRVGFRVHAAALSPVSLGGLSREAQLDAGSAAGAVWREGRWESFLPASGEVHLAWRPAATEQEGRLFFATEMVTQAGVSPGLLRQVTWVRTRVMQGEMTEMTLGLEGEGEVTRVHGAQVLAWSLQPGEGGVRRLRVQFNQPQRDASDVVIELQQPLGAFPLAVTVPRWTPEGSTRVSGHLRVVNEGAVRLEVVESAGLSQVSPEQFPGGDVVSASMAVRGSQVFAYRFSGGETRMRVQADNILPELTVSEVLVYRLGETDLSVDVELEVDIREAPLREVTVRVPRGFGVARMQAAGVSDSVLTEPTGEGPALLRLVYGAPVLGRQVVSLRLERNAALSTNRWDLPRVEVERAKAVRGHVGVVADAGWRVLAGGSESLTEVAPAFFPRKVPGLQLAFRLTDPGWRASVLVERLAQSVEADALHLFSVGEGVAYGSTLVNYTIAGAPVSVFRVELSGEYFNVEFTGKNIRNWQRTTNGFEVFLHTPASGAYTLLATYERPFQPRGEVLGFTGARPVDAQVEQGYTLVVSTYQFQVRTVSVSPSLMPLETGEVPVEYRLFFDAPLLAAYRYTARPFNLQLELTPLAQGQVIGQVVDRAALVSRVSAEGQVVTEARYFVKSKGNPHLRLVLPEGAELWSVTADGATVVPVQDEQGMLIPLPAKADPDVVTELLVRAATRAASATRLSVEAPRVAAPVLLADWRLEPAPGRKLVYLGGVLQPEAGQEPRTGFAVLSRLFRGDTAASAVFSAIVVFLGVLVTVVLWSGWPAEGGRFGLRHLLSGLLGTVALVTAVLSAVNLHRLSDGLLPGETPGLQFLTPVQQAGAAWEVRVGNVEADATGIGWFSTALIVGAALGTWVWSLFSSRTWIRRFGGAMAWTLLFWGALRVPAGLGVALWVFWAFLVMAVVLPSLRRWWAGPGPEEPVPGPGAAVVLALIGCGWAGLGLGEVRAAVPGGAVLTPLAQSVSHQVVVSNEWVRGVARVRWEAKEGERLRLFREPGVLTRSGHPSDRARLVQVDAGGGREHLLVARADGTLDFELEYQTRTQMREGSPSFRIPVLPGLANRAQVQVAGREADVNSAQAVSVERLGEATVLVLAPSEETWVHWQPRARDTSLEEAVVYAEWAHLWVPWAGVVEGTHQVQVRPAQGEVRELEVTIPAGLAISDVSSEALHSWRFDPEANRLRITLSPAQSAPFRVTIQSQRTTGALPYVAELMAPSLEGVAGQVGMAGIATGAEVQLESATVEGLSAINLEDFSLGTQPARQAAPAPTVRRAFRYSGVGGRITLRAVAVEPDVRVEAQQTLSLGEDRTLLAATLRLEILRAGIFKWSFPLPGGFEVESASGAALSHWTELETEAGRVVTLHLKGKTLGQQDFNLVLTSGGLRSTNGWSVPRLAVREASRQRGQLAVVPEQGLRLQVARREGVSQVDPEGAGVRQKGVLAFRLLQAAWELALDVERIDAWIQVSSLQHVVFAENQARVTANLQYDIENTGIRAITLGLPVGADSVRILGEGLGEPVAAAITAGATMRDWEVKLERRVLGRYLVQVSYSVPIPEQSTVATVEGIEARGVQVQRGFLTLQSGGRLQVRAESSPTVQPTEWQMIPRLLQQGVGASASSHAFRLVEARFQLPVTLERREAARLLPARVEGVELTSVISGEGTMLTRVQVRLTPGDKRLLHLLLPDGARFWFAFVNDKSVWPWQATNQVLLPLDPNPRRGEPTAVEFFYSASAGRGGERWLDLRLQGPKLDLPLENIRWHVYLDERWRVTDWSGTLELQEEQGGAVRGVVDLSEYVREQGEIRQSKTRQAEQFLGLANDLLARGDPQEARRAFQAAYGMSLHDQAFNEDARVQLNNLRMQQALVGLNVRQARVVGEGGGTPAAAPKGIWDNQAATYTQSEAKQLLERNTAEENAVQARLAERLIQQQDAAVGTPAAIRASLPEQGQRLTFTRALDVNPWSELRLAIEARATRAASLGWRLLVVGVCFAGVALVLTAGRRRSTAGRA